jgi:hypothetical protein
MEGVLTYFDILLVPMYLVLILLICSKIKSKNISIYPEYKYFIWGIIFKLMGVSAFISIYLFYYEGGDTNAYFYGAKAVANLLLQDFDKGLDVLFNLDSVYNNFSVFNYDTGFPPNYMWRDPKTFSVCRFTAIFSIISLNSYIVTSFLTACFSFVGVWKLYRLFNDLYPGNSRVFAFSILFLPSLVFWGGGIMKDSYVLGATCWITYNFHKLFIKKEKILLNLLFFTFNLVIIINTKAYVIISLLPAMALWINSAYLTKIKNSIIKILVFPAFIFVIILAGLLAFNNLSSFMGIYGNVDSTVRQAQIIQDDLTREGQYGKNNYDLGEINNSLEGLIKVAPLAIFTALFRPLFWEIGSPTMVLSVLENSILLIFTIFLLLRAGPVHIIRILIADSFLLYCFIFSIIFAYGVGVAGTNFGALVRYKITLLPFFLPMIYIIYKKKT